MDAAARKINLAKFKNGKAQYLIGEKLNRY